MNRIREQGTREHEILPKPTKVELYATGQEACDAGIQEPTLPAKIIHKIVKARKPRGKGKDKEV